ncbi:MAG: glycosyltransferase family 39 protein [Verrucomicrobiota bacterium]|nr:glycosyltransferase family 39 protein [Verrucomicrobiota bacterium]
MLDSLQSLDIALFRLINDSLSNPLFDKLMPLLSDNALFAPAIILISIEIFWKGGARGRLCVVFAILAVALGDSLICNTIKQAVNRPRPFNFLADAHVLIGRGGSGSLPSSHAANWFAATMIAFIYYRRSWRFMLPMALLVSFSRVYNGVHFPSDVWAGAILGAGYSAALVWTSDALWQFFGMKWFPIWWQKLPSLLHPAVQIQNSKFKTENLISLDQHWLRFGYVFIFLIFLARLAYLASGKIELSEDEAYQWTWSKHPALSYYSKPPLIAYTQFLGTHLWGDNEFGVRFFSPLIAAVISLLLFRFVSRETNPRAGFVLLVIFAATPLMAVGATLMTIDPLSVLFWTAAMLAGWRAVQENENTRHWLWVGLWMGLGCLSKYTNLFQWLSWITFFILWPPARKQFRTRDPYLAFFIAAVFSLPVLIWNAQHHWITLEHISNDGKLTEPWHPTLRYVFDFIGSEFILLNPVFFLAMILAALLFWKRERKNPLLIFLFSMGAPLFLFYFAFSFHSRVLPNWIAPSLPPLFCLMIIYWHSRWSPQARILERFLYFGLIFGFTAVILLHETNLISKIIGRPLPAQVNPLRRVRAWQETAAVVETARQNLAAEGKPAFIIGDHYGITGELSFYIPEAKANIKNNPLVYFLASEYPRNQFYFWPNYKNRRGQNAIYVQQLDSPKLMRGWFWKWLQGHGNIYLSTATPRKSPPLDLEKQFRSVTDLGVIEIKYRGQTFRYLQLFACRDLRN